MSTAARANVHSAMDEMKVGGIGGFLNLLTMSFTLMIFVNIAALILGFMGAGCFREFLFGQQDTEYPCLVRTGQCMLGPLALIVVRMFLWVTFALQLVLSYVFLLVGLLIFAAAAICHSGAVAVRESQKLFTDMGDDIDMTDTCHAITRVGLAGFMLFAGCGLTVFSQAAMLSALASEQAQIEDEMKKNAPTNADEPPPPVNDLKS